MNVEINDIRSQSDFKGITFSKFQKSKVKAELLRCMHSAKVEPACYWAAELICAGHLLDLWETIILYMSKEIHLGCPKLPVYIAKRFTAFKNIVANGYIGQELRLRNNSKIRELFSEVIMVLCYANKKHSYTVVSIKKDEDFNMTSLTAKLQAPHVDFASGIFKKSDPKELFIAINEFCYHISSSNSGVDACYWLEWIMEFEKRCKKQKNHCLCERRTYPTVQEKYQMDSIWIIWEALLHVCKTTENLVVMKIMNALLEIYCIHYSAGIKRRRRFILYFAVSLLTEPVDISILMINRPDRIKSLSKKTDIVYRDVKKNEQSPATEYLEVNKSVSNLDKTIERLEKMSQLESF